MINGATYYTYIFVRRDLPEAQRVIQALHAVQGAANIFKKIDIVPHAVLFEVADEAALISVSRTIKAQNFMFYEPDYDRGYTALATVPITGVDRDEFYDAGYVRYDSGLVSV